MIDTSPRMARYLATINLPNGRRVRLHALIVKPKGEDK